MAAVMLQVNPSFYANFSKNIVFIPADTYEKYIVKKESCIDHHDAKVCFLSHCRYHTLFFGNVGELLQKLDPLCFTYQHVNCQYRLFKYRLNQNFVVKCGQVFDIVQRAVSFNQRNREVDRMPSTAKKRLLRKKYRKHFFRSFQERQWM